ncbi:hypothetical protein C3L33_19022, partial [Rhododendron williamsianum]
MAVEMKKTPDLPWRIRIFFTAVGFVVDRCRRSDGTMNRSVMNLFDFKSQAGSAKGVTSSDITVDRSRNLWFRIYTPTASRTTVASKLPVIFYFHGGGFILFGPDSRPFDELCRHLAGKLPAIVVSINYRLAPEHRYPCQFEDGFDTLKFIDSNSSLLPPNADLSHCFFAGESAGANIAHHVTLKAAAHDFRKLKIVGLIAMQPYFGGEERTESERRLTKVPVVNVERTDWSWKALLPEGCDRDHEAVNVFGGPKSKDISSLKFPATLLVVGGFDPLQDWQRKYHVGLKKSRKEVYLVEYPNAIHGFYLFPELTDFTPFVTEVRRFIQKQSESI